MSGATDLRHGRRDRVGRSDPHDPRAGGRRVNVESAVDDMIALLHSLEQPAATRDVLSSMTEDELRDVLTALLIATHAMFGSARTDESLADLWRRRRADLIHTVNSTNGGTNGGSH